MDWSAYKSLCDSPHTFSRWMLEQSLELLADEALLAERVATVLRDTPLERPADHRGGAPTDMFTVALSAMEARAIDAVVTRAVADGRTTMRTRARGLGGFREAWHEYAMYVERIENSD
ncbi:MAG TPA: hypothetical protein VIZ30_03085 [Pseudomonadales bacterium]